MGKLVPMRQLPPDPLEGCRMITDRGGTPPPKTSPGRAALTIALCAASLAYTTACIAAPTIMYLIPAVAAAICAGITRRLT